MRRAPVSLVLVSAALLSATTACADESVDQARARQLAGLLRIEPQIEMVLQATPPVTVDESIAHLRAVERAVIALSRATLDVEAMLARLQHEEFEAKNAHDFIESRHEDSIARWNIAAVLVGNGVSVIGSAMQFGSDTVAKWGDGLIIAGSAVAAAFSIVALVRRDVGRSPLAIETNLLAPFFGRASPEASRYPAGVWRYLDTPLVGATGSIRQQLVEKWTREGRLPRGDARALERRLSLLAEPLRAARRIDADVLDDRADMLADVRERVAGLTVDLELLWREVHALR